MTAIELNQPTQQLCETNSVTESECLTEPNRFGFELIIMFSLTHYTMIKSLSVLSSTLT